jgi:hypothetical protein
MGKFFERLLGTEGDPTVQVIDLVLFLGYFSVCLYGGGVAYESAYNDAFHLQIKPNVGDPRVAIGFVTNVLLTHWYWIPASLYLLVFIFVFYASRYVWRPWFGYFLLSFLLYSTFLMCGLMGKTIGGVDAAKDKLQETTSKPEIKLYCKTDNNEFASGKYRLLYEVDKWFFVFEPQGVQGSLIEVHAIPKTNVEQYEVIIK